MVSLRIRNVQVFKVVYLHCSFSHFRYLHRTCEAVSVVGRGREVYEALAHYPTEKSAEA